MGIDVNAVIAFGIHLTEDQVYEMTSQSEYNPYELFENLFESYHEHDAIYDGLSGVPFGSDEYPDWVIAVKTLYSKDWEATEFDVNKLLFTLDESKLTETLRNFCEDYDIPFEPKWYFGGQYG